MGFDLGSEMADDISHRTGSSLTQTAVGERFHVFTQVLIHPDPAASRALCDAGNDFLGSLCSHTAGGAFPTAFEPEELHQYFCQVNHAGIFITD